MKLREIILDFTSLLDVIMIILFWFILNYQTETTKIREKANAAEAAAAEAQIIAEERQQAAEEHWQAADDALTALESADARQASIQRAIRDFRQGKSLHLKLISDQYHWYVVVTAGEDTELGRIYSEDEKQFGTRLNAMLAEAGFAPDATVFCVLSYDSSEAGSLDAYNSVTREIRNIQLGNQQFSCTEIDRAIPEEAAP